MVYAQSGLARHYHSAGEAMMRRLVIISLVVTGIVCHMSACSNSEARRDRIYVHFLVAPATFSDGSSADKAVSELKDYLLTSAGGYTELLNSQGCWINPKGTVEKENNFSFMVSAQKNMSAELKGYVSKHFGQQYPYVIVWKALSN
jgi:hypothetical protein